MIPSHEETRAAALGLAALMLVACLSGCTRNLVERAIDARGGPLESYRKDVKAVVHLGMPGEWEWEVAYRVPDSFRWSIQTWGEQQRVMYDGETARHQLGSATLPPAAGGDETESQARWFAVTSLDVLEDPRVAWEELPPDELPEGAARGLAARFEDDPARFELYFDERDLLTRARGPVSLEPIGSGLVDASFGDYRPVDGYLFPFRGAYRLGDRPLMEESALRWEPNPDFAPGTFGQ